MYANFVPDLALSILEKLVQTRWKILPREQALGKAIRCVLRETNVFLLGIRHFIVALIVKNASDERTMRNEKVYINKLNLVLVEVSLDKILCLRTLDPQTRLAAELARVYLRNRCVKSVESILVRKQYGCFEIT